MKKQQGLRVVNFTKGFIVQVDIVHHLAYFDVLRWNKIRPTACRCL